MVMAGQCTPHFLFSVAPKRENGPCTVQKRKGAGAEFGRKGQIRPNYGGWSEPMPISLATLLPGALDSVPCGGALPHLRLPTRLFWCVDAGTSFSSRALRLAGSMWDSALFYRFSCRGRALPRPSPPTTFCFPVEHLWGQQPLLAIPPSTSSIFNRRLVGLVS